jgi:transposase
VNSVPLQSKLHPGKPWRDKELMEDLYIRKGMSGYDIAQRFGCTNQTVYRWLRTHGLKGLNDVKSKAASGELTVDELKSEEWLRQKYESEGLTVQEIAEELDCGTTTVSRHLSKHGIATRNTDPPLRYPGKYYSFKTDHQGYERWGCGESIHRLAAVAWFGLESVEGKQIHHKNGVPWDNREENLMPLSPSEHSKQHSNPGNFDNRVTVNLSKDQAHELLNVISEFDGSDGILDTICDKVSSQLPGGKLKQDGDRDV